MTGEPKPDMGGPKTSDEQESIKFTEQDLIEEMLKSGELGNIIKGQDTITAEDVIMNQYGPYGLTDEIERWLNNFYDGKELESFSKEEAKKIIKDVFIEKFNKIIDEK